jgi:hypothetical protein
VNKKKAAPEDRAAGCPLALLGRELERGGCQGQLLANCPHSCLLPAPAHPEALPSKGSPELVERVEGPILNSADESKSMS